MSKYFSIFDNQLHVYTFASIMKVVIRIISICLLVTAFGNSYAQALRGIVVNSLTGSPIYPVTVVNKVTQQSVYTNENGAFLISAKNGETIIFSSIGYQTFQKNMPPSLGVIDMRIELSPLNVSLDEILVRPKYTQYQFDSIRRHSTYQRTLARQNSSVMSPVSFIAERISKKSRQINAFKKSYNAWEDIRFVDSRYTPELVSRLTKLTGDSLANFMNAYPMPYDYARTATELEIQMWVRNNYKAWIKYPFIRNSSIDSLNKEK